MQVKCSGGPRFQSSLYFCTETEGLLLPQQHLLLPLHLQLQLQYYYCYLLHHHYHHQYSAAASSSHNHHYPLGTYLAARPCSRCWSVAAGVLPVTAAALQLQTHTSGRRAGLPSSSRILQQRASKQSAGAVSLRHSRQGWVVMFVCPERLMIGYILKRRRSRCGINWVTFGQP